MATILISILIFSFCAYVIGKNISRRLKGDKSCGCSGGCAGCGVKESTTRESIKE